MYRRHGKLYEIETNAFFKIVKIYDTLHLMMKNCYNDKFKLYKKD